MTTHALAREIDSPTADSEDRHPVTHALPRLLRHCGKSFPRGFALFLGGFGLLNLAGGLAVPGFDANIWWIDLHLLPSWLELPFIALVGSMLVAYAIAPPRSRTRRVITLLTVVAAFAMTLINAVVFYSLLDSGILSGGFPLPFSLLIATGLLLVTGDLLSSSRSDSPHPVAVAAMVAVCMVLFPLMQMLCFGYTDYRRPADAVVVFGARAYADGSLSTALADRVRTACMLYHEGLAPRLIFSGGPGDGGVHETEAMRSMAMELGVPDEAILLDRRGVNTRATAEETARILHDLGARHVMAVSHFYHLPRVKMAYHHMGWNVYTVPAEESYTLTAMPIYMMREIAGLWVYYLGGFRNG